MDFEPTERQVYWRDRVKNFIEQNVRPAVPTYKAQDAEGDRWKVIPVIEELKAKAKGEGSGTCSCPRATMGTTMLTRLSNLRVRA